MCANAPLSVWAELTRRSRVPLLVTLWPSRTRRGGGPLRLCEQLVERGAVEESPVQDDGADPRRVVDVGQWVGVEQDEVGELVLGDGAKRGAWRQPGAHQELELAVERESRHEEWSPDVGPGEDGHTLLVGELHQ